VTSRSAAVTRAKKLSERGRARVERKDGRVQMTFSGGHLTQYIFEIGGRR
jgi:hypothetical protein